MRSRPWHGHWGLGLCFTNWARNRNDHRWEKSMNSSDRRLCCSFVQMAIVAVIVQHVGVRKNKQASTWIPGSTGIRWGSLHNFESRNLYSNPSYSLLTLSRSFFSDLQISFAHAGSRVKSESARYKAIKKPKCTCTLGRKRTNSPQGQDQSSLHFSLLFHFIAINTRAIPSSFTKTLKFITLSHHGKLKSNMP